MPLPHFDPADRDALCELRHLAEAAARAGGSVARRYFRGELQVRLKADRTEVSDADHAAQQAVVATIRAARPDDAFLTEETLETRAPCHSPANDRLTWIIDPIDGTRNFVRRIPLYACSVGAMFGGYPVVGSIHDAERDVTYTASTAEGLFINAEAQPVATLGRGRAAGLDPRPVVALPSTPTGPIAPIAHTWLGRFVCRNLGSTALHLAQIAAGQLDGALSDNAKLWDLAAGWVLLQAIGGRMTTRDGAAVFPLDIARYADADLPFIAGTADFFARLAPLQS